MDEFDTPLYAGPLTQSMADRTGMTDFAKNGCPQFGTAQCVRCDLAEYIPRTDCSPPEECFCCACRPRCPCGNAAFKRILASTRSRFTAS